MSMLILLAGLCLLVLTQDLDIPAKEGLCNSEGSQMH